MVLVGGIKQYLRVLMATNYVKLQIYFIISLFIGYLAFLAVWFNIDDRAMRMRSENDFREVLQIRNQLRDNLFNSSKETPYGDNKLRVLRVICNDWLNSLEREITSKRQFEKQRIRENSIPILNTSGVYILKNKRMYLNLGENFEDRFGENWTKDFFSALKHGGRYFSTFMSRFYNRPVSLKEFRKSIGKYETLKIRGRYYYRYYTKIKNFEVLVIIDLHKSDPSITLDHYIESLVKNDVRLERGSTDSFLWAEQETVLSGQIEYGLNFKPYRSGWIDFVLAKWISHILFSLLIIFLIGLGGYQILSLRLEFRVLAFFASCFLGISLVYHLQFKKLERIQSELSHHNKMNLAHDLRQNLNLKYKKGLQTIKKQLDEAAAFDYQMPIKGILLAANLEGKTQVVDNIEEPILLKILSEIINRWHLVRKGFNPSTISLSDSVSNSLKIETTPIKSFIAPHIINYVLNKTKQIIPGHDGQRLLNFHLHGQEMILILPGKRQFSADVIRLLCIRRDDLIKYVASRMDWKLNRIAIVNQRTIQSVFQNFRPAWTNSKIEKFLVNRQMPSTLRDNTDIQWIHLNWDEMILLVKISSSFRGADGPRDAIISILFLLLGLISIFVVRTGLFNWLAKSTQLLNSYRLHKQLSSYSPGWFRNEGFAFNTVVERFLKSVDSAKQYELKMAPALDQILVKDTNLVAQVAVIELLYCSLQKELVSELSELISAELKRFNGFQIDAGAKRLNLCFPLELDSNGVQNAAEAGLAICEYLREHTNCEFFLILRKGNFEIKFNHHVGVNYPILAIRANEVQEGPNRYSPNELIIDEDSYKVLLGLYDLELIEDNYYRFNLISSEG